MKEETVTEERMGDEHVCGRGEDFGRIGATLENLVQVVKDNREETRTENRETRDDMRLMREHMEQITTIMQESVKAKTRMDGFDEFRSDTKIALQDVFTRLRIVEQTPAKQAQEKVRQVLTWRHDFRMVVIAAVLAIVVNYASPGGKNEALQAPPSGYHSPPLTDAGRHNPEQHRGHP